MAKKNRTKTSYKVDFTDVESNALFPEIAGRFKVEEVKFIDNDGDGAFNWKWSVVDCDNAKMVGKTFSDRTSLSEGALWNLRNRLEALGVEIPAGPLDIDFEELKGLELEADNSHREWEGKSYNQLGNYVAVDESESSVKVTDKRKAVEEDEEEEEPKSKKKRARDEDEDEAPKKKRKSEEEDEEEPKSKKKSRKDEEEEDEAPKKKKPRDEEDEDEAPKKKRKSEEDEDEKPSKKKRSDDEEEEKPAKKSKKKYTEDEVRDMDEEELEDLNEKHELGVKLSKIDNLRKKRIAIWDALDEAGLGEE